jgi:hypothetical protein
MSNMEPYSKRRRIYCAAVQRSMYPDYIIFIPFYDKLIKTLLHNFWIFVTNNTDASNEDQTGQSSGNSLESYSGGTRFKYRPEHRLSSLRYLVGSLSPPHKFQDKTSITLRSLSFKSFPIHQSPCHQMLCSFVTNSFAK